MIIANDCVVAFHYTLTDEAGAEIDTSKGQEPLAYLHGHGGIIPGLERELTGKTTGDAMKVTVQPEDGYGELNPELIQAVPREAFQGVDQIEVGMQFQASGAQGQVQTVVVKAVDDESVTVDANHPLAGQVLQFDVSIEEVRVASEEELSHGHVHGAGGHQH
ncbi:FKBP-type peptidylprolyl isomerase [gamma proteobacterium BDW918]|jgi:FKBP-type peptidyl-prolyl cis-trans isomerase SlyD|uniref:Peptidyl-prolyl cis-trans isomerase n=1 Tax=Zhongshania aliphaticivorans TaxID=1470434 RepID=A0A127M1M6_9GAMM|nr:peptidylprolyl isomerase [Zhongshania aliphaticivorans]AMO67125.1 peptidylprolyl isomerase [Zhongshania aliphaticivorans]EIF42552.1 FKBP-type peptidylprolyl isomerase [gamma proteobacterium BDW918]|tara:strand:+ start:1639 stop:2124 length:486 start_codon:yes stop_codon:yes gene_type:complete